MFAEACDHARCSGNRALIILEFMILDFEGLLQHRKKNTIKSSKADDFAYWGALGVLKNSSGMYFSS